MKTNEEFRDAEFSRVAMIRGFIAMEEARIADRYRELKEAEERGKYFAAKADMDHLMKMVADLPPYDDADHDALLAVGAAVE